MEEEDSASDGPAPRGERNALKRRREQVREASRRFRERKKMEMDEMAGQVQELRDELDAARAALAAAGLSVHPPGRHAATSTSSGGSSRGERAEVSQLRAQVASLQAQLGKGSDSKGENGGKYSTRSRAGHGPGSGSGVTAQEEGSVPTEQHQQLYATYTQNMEELTMTRERENMLLNLLSRLWAVCGKSFPPALGLEVSMALQSHGSSLTGGGLLYGGLGPLVPASVTGDGFMMASGQYLSHLPGATPGGSGRTTPDRQGGHSTGPSQGGEGTSSSTGGRRGTPAGGQGEQQDTSMLPMMLSYSHPYGTGGSDFGGSAGGPPVLPLPSLTMDAGTGTGTGGAAPAAYIPMAAAGTDSSTSPQEVHPASIRSLLDTATKDIAAFAAGEWLACPWPATVLWQYGGQQTKGKRASPGSAAGQPQTVPDPLLQLEWQVPLPSASPASVSMRVYSIPKDQPILSTKWTARVMGVTCEQMALALWEAHTEQGQARLFSAPPVKGSGADSSGSTCGQLTCIRVDTLDDKDPTFGTIIEMTHPALEHAVRACDSASPGVTLHTCCGVRRVDAVPCSLLATCLDSATALPPLTEVDGEGAGYGNASRGEIGVERDESDPLLWLGILRSPDEGDDVGAGTGAEGTSSGEQGGGADGPRECRVYGGWIIRRSKVGSREGCVVIYLEQLQAGLGASAAAVHSEYMSRWPARVTALVTLAGSKGEQEAMHAAAGTTSMERILCSSPSRAGAPSMPAAAPGVPPFAVPMPMPMPMAYAPAFGGVLMQSMTPRTQGMGGMGGMSEHMLVTPPGGSLALMGGEHAHEDSSYHAAGQGNSASTARHRASPSQAGNKRARTSSMASRDGGGDLSGPLPVRGMAADRHSRTSLGRPGSRASGQGAGEQEGDNVSGSNLSGLDMLVQFLGPNGRG